MPKLTKDQFKKIFDEDPETVIGPDWEKDIEKMKPEELLEKVSDKRKCEIHGCHMHHTTDVMDSTNRVGWFCLICDTNKRIEDMWNLAEAEADNIKKAGYVRRHNKMLGSKEIWIECCTKSLTQT